MTEHWRPAYVGIGSNLDDPEKRVAEAFESLAGIPRTRLFARSGVYRSAPVGGVEQPDFINAAASLLTLLEPMRFLEELQDIEHRHGRRRDGARWGPRRLDLDLLVYSGRRSDEAGLMLPHPRIAERNFVLLPLREIAPDLVIPGLGRVAGIPVNHEVPRIERLAQS
jgi:2-amino-4-hydroxy-6-hydroxymethyldihydropteridine diphosphokinase